MKEFYCLVTYTINHENELCEFNGMEEYRHNFFYDFTYDGIMNQLLVFDNKAKKYFDDYFHQNKVMNYHIVRSVYRHELKIPVLDVFRNIEDLSHFHTLQLKNENITIHKVDIPEFNWVKPNENFDFFDWYANG